VGKSNAKLIKQWKNPLHQQAATDKDPFAFSREQQIVVTTFE
jgi:hypothetical protein